MKITREQFLLVYKRLNRHFAAECRRGHDVEPIRNAYDRIMAYGRRHDLAPWTR